MSIVGTASDSSVTHAPQGVAVSGRYAYVTEGDLGIFSIVDISNPSRPQVVSSLTDLNYLAGAGAVAIAG